MGPSSAYWHSSIENCSTPPKTRNSPVWSPFPVP
jgi:hypothetical protein